MIYEGIIVVIIILLSSGIKYNHGIMKENKVTPQITKLCWIIVDLRLVPSRNKNTGSVLAACAGSDKGVGFHRAVRIWHNTGIDESSLN